MSARDENLKREIRRLGDSRLYIRGQAAEALGALRDVRAVPALIAVLKDKDQYVRGLASRALRDIGDHNALPRKVLAEKRFSPQERIDTLKALARIYYTGKHGILSQLSYFVPDVREFCEKMLQEDDPDVQQGARTVLNWLNGDNTLVRPAERDPAQDATTLLRPARERVEADPDMLVRPSSGEKMNE